MNAPFVIGIAGGSASGKSTLSAALIDHLLPAHTALLPHDAYYRGSPEGTDPPFINYDHPDALETSLCVDHLRRLRTGAPVEIPVYDFAQHCRSRQRCVVDPAPYIIVEGILVLHEPALREQMDLRVFVEAGDEVCLQRRIRRDSSERGRSEDSVREQWETTVLPMHVQFVAPTKEYAHIVVDGTSIRDRDVREVVRMVQRTVGLRC